MNKEEYLERWPRWKQLEYPVLHAISLPEGTKCYWGSGGITYIYPWDVEEALAEADYIVNESWRQLDPELDQ